MLLKYNFIKEAFLAVETLNIRLFRSLTDAWPVLYNTLQSYLRVICTRLCWNADQSDGAKVRLAL